MFIYRLKCSTRQGRITWNHVVVADPLLHGDALLTACSLNFFRHSDVDRHGHQVGENSMGSTQREATERFHRKQHYSPYFKANVGSPHFSFEMRG